MRGGVKERNKGWERIKSKRKKAIREGRRE